MLMSVVEEAHAVACHPELAGKRVLITGLNACVGVDLVRAFADHKARLVLQFAEQTESMDALAEIAARSALEVASYGPVDSGSDGAVGFARTAVQAFGGLDVVINLVPLHTNTIDAASDVDDIERLVADRLTLPLQLSKIAANRMAMMMTDGLILNVATVPAVPSGAARAFASVMKSALSGLTRSQAEEWAPKGVRFNAIAPQTSDVSADPGLNGEANVALLSLYLASAAGRSLSGHVFEANCARC